MSKFKEYMWKTFFPISYKCNEVTKKPQNQGNNPTIQDLLKTRADDNAENISIWKEYARKHIYKEWVESIDKKQDLKWDDEHKIKGDTDYTFSVDIRHDGCSLIKSAVNEVLEDILVDHPDIRFKHALESPTHDVYEFDYSDCLNDTIPLDVFKDDNINLINKWKIKRNQ